MTFYGYRRCSTSNRARGWIRDKGFPVDEERDLVLEPLAREEIMQLVQLAGGIEPLLSKKSPKFKQYQDKVAKATDWLTYMAEEPRLIKRPIVVHRNAIFIGFNPEQWEALAL